MSVCYEKVFQRVAVLMGGVSREREVSLKSGKAVAEALRQAGRQVLEVDIRKREVDLPATIDGVFIALHGAFGEDGAVQELLEERGIPYTGSGPASSRLAFNKKLAKKVFLEHDILTPQFEILQRAEQRALLLPVVVKPLCQGSSLGVYKVESEQEWERMFYDAACYDGEAIVEEYIDGRELTVGMVRGELLPIIEIKAPDGNYDYRAKYFKGLTEYLVPARLDKAIEESCLDLSDRAFRALGCRGFGRADLRLAADGTVYMLEVNTIPGFTETSLLPKAAASIGCRFCDLCDRIMQAAALDADGQNKESNSVV